MTFDEWWKGTGIYAATSTYAEKSAAKKAWNAAVAAEREACAKVCETHTFGSPWQTTKYEQEPSTTRKPKMPEITLYKAASVSKLAQNQLAELRSEIARLRMFEPCCKRDSLPASQSINPTNLEYWGIA